MGLFNKSPLTPLYQREELAFSLEPLTFNLFLHHA